VPCPPILNEPLQRRSCRRIQGKRILFGCIRVR
jgi:hypothetical protein